MPGDVVQRLTAAAISRSAQKATSHTAGRRRRFPAWGPNSFTMAQGRAPDESSALQTIVVGDGATGARPPPSASPEEHDVGVRSTPTSHEVPSTSRLRSKVPGALRSLWRWWVIGSPTAAMAMSTTRHRPSRRRTGAWWRRPAWRSARGRPAAGEADVVFVHRAGQHLRHAGGHRQHGLDGMAGLPFGAGPTNRRYPVSVCIGLPSGAHVRCR